MASEKFGNNVQTTLNGSINNSQTTIIVLSSTGVPSVNFRIVIDSEIMLVTNVSGVTWTVTRGQEGTAATFHGDQSAVSHIITAGSLNKAFADNCQTGVDSSLPAAEKAGRLYFATDLLKLYRDNGSSWDVIVPSQLALATATFGSTTTLDLSTSRDQLLVLTNNSILALSNEPATGRITVALKQGGSGSYAVTWWSGIKWAGGTVPTLTATVGKYDLFVFLKVGSGEYLGSVAGQNY